MTVECISTDGDVAEQMRKGMKAHLEEGIKRLKK
jgi:hypothetical protein